MLVMQITEKHKMAGIAILRKDYSGYNFRFDCGALKAKDVEVLLMLLTVAQCIDCKVIKGQIAEAIDNMDLKDWIIHDVLMEADETFFSKEIIGKTLKNVFKMDENLLVDAFTEILNKINYQLIYINHGC